MVPKGSFSNCLFCLYFGWLFVNFFNVLELLYLLSLSQINGIGPVSGKTMISFCGSAEAVFREKSRALEKIPGIGKSGAAAIKAASDRGRAEQEMAFMEKNGIQAISYTDPDYPIRLKQVLDSPLVLFIKGNADLNHHRIAGIVGTRKNTQDGSHITREIVKGLKPHDCHVISGLAHGIDTVAHKACIENDIPTMAVLAHGLDMIYPLKNQQVAEKMLDAGGAIITEFFSGTDLHPDLFPRRNRIVAGMCDALLVVESMIKGGSMITAQIAHSYDRDVFAVPGKPGDIMSEGCNYLIKSLKAALCEDANDIARGLNWDTLEGSQPKKQYQYEMFLNLTPEERLITEQLSGRELHIDELMLSTGLPAGRLTLLLLELEMKGLIRALPGKQYKMSRPV